MARVRFSGRSSSSRSCQCSARAAITRSAIMSSAVSRSRSSHPVPYGRRYRTVRTRSGLVTRLLLAEPLGHSRPREIGESGSPSIWVTRPSLTYTRCPQPTAQYGQTERATLSAVCVRAVSAADRGDCAAGPRPSGSVPVSCWYTGQLLSNRRMPMAPNLDA